MTLDGVVTGRAWCESCLLPSRVAGNIYRISNEGVASAGTFNICATPDCQQRIP